jgi:hypothetical protein
MPVIINELIIRAEVGDKPSGSSSTTNNTSPKAAAEDREALIQDCVSQVLEILEKKKMP